jgi:uncharacterized protein (TIGR02001 family)
MNRWMLCCLACLAPLAEAPAAEPQWGGAVTLSSNYLLRGVSRSNNDPALSAELHGQLASGLFGSLWASTSRVRAADDTSVEFGATLGFVARINDNWATSWSYSHYESPGFAFADFYRYDELKVDLRFQERLQLSVSHSPNTSRYAPGYGPVWHRSATAFEAGYQQRLGHGLRGYAGAGYYDLSALFGQGYWYGSLGFGWSAGHWSVDLSYVIPDSAARRLSYPPAADRRALASLAFSF